MTQVNWASSPAAKTQFLNLFTKRGGTRKECSSDEDAFLDDYFTLFVDVNKMDCLVFFFIQHFDAVVDILHSNCRWKSIEVCPCRWPWTVILPRVLALPAELVAKHMYWPESSAVMLSKISVQEPSGSSMMMWWGSASTGRPSIGSDTTQWASGVNNITFKFRSVVWRPTLVPDDGGLGHSTGLAG